MYPQLRERVVHYAGTIAPAGKTLEIGCYDYCGGVRDLFTDYIGIDLNDGPGVDKVMNAHDIPLYYPVSNFDTVVWLEAAEHDPAFWLTVESIEWVLKKGGHLIFSAPQYYFPPHPMEGTGMEDNWRFSNTGVRHMLRNFTILELSEVRGEKAYTGTWVALARLT
jgi:SAM-dependent methyltransferase